MLRTLWNTNETWKMIGYNWESTSNGAHEDKHWTFVNYARRKDWREGGRNLVVRYVYCYFKDEDSVLWLAIEIHISVRITVTSQPVTIRSKLEKRKPQFSDISKTFLSHPQSSYSRYRGPCLQLVCVLGYVLGYVHWWC